MNQGLKVTLCNFTVHNKLKKYFPVFAIIIKFCIYFSGSGRYFEQFGENHPTFCVYLVKNTA